MTGTRCSSATDPDRAQSVRARVRRVTAVAMPGNQVELADGRVVALPAEPNVVGHVLVALCLGDELAIWTTDSDPKLLALHLPTTA